jgi:AcrR family transcriptional regulator
MSSRAGQECELSGSEEKKPVRQRILETASEMFYRDGVRAVGIDAVIERSGVAKMSLYRNFPSKDALVTAWLEDRNEFFWRRWDRVEASRAGDPRGQIEAILDMFSPEMARLPLSQHRHRISRARPPGAGRDPCQQTRCPRPSAVPRLGSGCTGPRSARPAAAAPDRRRLRHRPVPRAGRPGAERRQRRTRADRGVFSRCATEGSRLMPTIRLAEGLSVHCAADDYLWPWEVSTPPC